MKNRTKKCLSLAIIFCFIFTCFTIPTYASRKAYGSSISKQFRGDLKVWLRSTQKIEYVINGDFYNNGTTTSSGGIGVNAGINQLVSISFTATSTTSSNHYKYFYEHDYYFA